MKEVSIIGVGIHPFGRFENKSYIEIGMEAVEMALKDANVLYKDIQAVYCGSMYLQATAGARIMANFGLNGIPIVDVECACASGAATMAIAKQAIVSGEKDMVLCLGVEKMPRGFMDPRQLYPDWEIYMGLSQNPLAWALQARRHMADYGTTEEHLAKVSVKNHRNAVHNPYAMYRKELTLKEVKNSPLVCDPLRLLELCAPNEGAAAVILCNGKLARRYTNKAVVMATAKTLTGSYPNMRGEISVSTKERYFTEIKTLCPIAYEDAGIGPDDIDLMETQDTDSWQEIYYTEVSGFCAEGEGGKLLDEGATEVTGRIPVNTSGGLLSKGEPIGASALGQVVHVVHQLRGQAGHVQVEGAKVGMAQVTGAQGNAGIMIIKK
jgi:acetyl-CoA C-acetyltransferase